MSVLQVANLHFNSVGSERIELIDGNVKVFTAGGFITETSRSSVFNGSTAEPLVRITQTGTGEAFRVEDSTNPDSTPFVIDAIGNVLIGRADSTIGNGVKLDINGGVNASSILVNGYEATGISTIDEKTDNYTLTISDVGHIITMNATTTKTITIPANSVVSFPIGARIDLMRYGTGNVNVTITTDTLSSTGNSLNLKSQYSVASLIKVKNTQWVLAGDIGSI